MNRLVMILSLGASLLVQAHLVQAQTATPASSASPPQAYALTKVTSSGSKRFPEADIVRATGLKPGGTVTADDLKQAADRLGQTSVFSQVSYRFDAQTAEYTVVDADPLMPASFENFIWFSDAELLQKVHASVPLFLGSVPLAGNLPDQVSSALDAILKEKGISGHTISALQSSPEGQPLAEQFRVAGVQEKIVEIRFPGAAPDHLPVLQEATKRLLGANYLKSPVSDQVKRAAAPVYGKLGFLKEQTGVPTVVILKDDPSQAQVALEVPIQEGDPYTFSTVHWVGVSSIPETELAKTVNLKPGGPADTTQLAGIVAVARQMFTNKGHMYAQVKSTATLDAEKHSAAFNLNVDEGPVYRMGKLEVQNLDASRAALVQRVWGIHEGDAYVASYVNTFLGKHPVELASLDGWTTRYTQTIHDDTHLVDLTLAFEKIRPDAK